MTTLSNEALSPEQIAFVRHTLIDPVRFAHHFLDVSLWQREAEILQSIKTHRRTAIKASHGVGKTFTLAVAALWWLARYLEGIVLTTSATQRQVRTQLWAEIHRLVERARVPYPMLKTTELKLRSSTNFALGFSTNQAENFQDFHGKHLLLLADEAPGLSSGIWDAVAATMAGGTVHVVMAGNPTVPAGAFFDAFTNQRSLWNCFTIDAFDSPNLRGLRLETLLQLDPTEGGPLDQGPFPFLVTKRWVHDQYWAWWHGTASSSPNWLARVLAQFPDQAENALINLAWLDRTRQRALESPVSTAGSVSLVAGVDVGGGEAETVVYVCDCRPDQYRIIGIGAWRGEDTRGRVVNYLDQFRSRLSTVRVDAIGIGHNFGLHLRDYRFPVELVNVAMACESRPQLGENDPARRFVNQKAQYYQNLADALERDQLDGLSDETTIGQLAGLLYELDGQGRIKIESKEEARERGIPSPDRADALMLATSQPYRKLEVYTGRDLARLRSQSGMTDPVRMKFQSLDVTNWTGSLGSPDGAVAVAPGDRALLRAARRLQRRLCQ